MERGQGSTDKRPLPWPSFSGVTRRPGPPSRSDPSGGKYPFVRGVRADSGGVLAPPAPPLGADHGRDWLERLGREDRPIRSNTFSMEWPPRSGRQREFPEIDRGGWFGLEEAAERISKGQRGLLVSFGFCLVMPRHSRAWIAPDPRMFLKLVEMKRRPRWASFVWAVATPLRCARRGYRLSSR